MLRRFLLFKVIYVRTLQDLRKRVLEYDGQPSFWKFNTDGIFFNASQQEIYETVMEEVVESVLLGCDGVVLAHGQTGSGKSYTIIGPIGHDQQSGILARILRHLFEKREDLRYEASVTFGMSMVEIQRSTLKDLLTGEHIATPLPHRDPYKVVAVVPVQSEAEAWGMVLVGETHRSTVASSPYQNSHFSHTVVTIHMENRSLVKSAAVTAYSKLHLVDLAGVNFVKKPSAEWLSYQQIVNANLDQALLSLYITKLLRASVKSGPKKPSSSQRLSTLVRYLGNSLEPSSVLRFIGHIIPDISNLAGTLSTLRFGAHVRGLQCHQLKFKSEPQPEVVLQKLKEEIVQVRRDLEVAQMVANLPVAGYMSQAYTHFTEKLIEKFVHGDIDEHVLLTNLDPKICLQVFKDLHNRCLVEKKTLDERLAFNENLSSAKLRSKEFPDTHISSEGRAHNMHASRRDSLAQKTATHTVQQAVGETTKSGISIGPGIASDFVGPASQEMKHKRVVGQRGGKSSRIQR